MFKREEELITYRRDNMKERWLRLSERRLDMPRAKRLLKEWQDRLGMGDYAFEIRLTNDRWKGHFGPILGVHYGELAFSTERTLVHELLECLLHRYAVLTGNYNRKLIDEPAEKDAEYLIRHIYLFQLTNALLRLKYGES